MNAVSERTEAPAWASRWLVAAGIYNLLWGTTTIAFPHLLFDVAGINRLNYPAGWPGLERFAKPRGFVKSDSSPGPPAAISKDCV